MKHCIHIALALVFLIACAPLVAIEDSSDAEFDRIVRRAEFVTNYTARRLVSEGKLTCEQAEKIANRIDDAADEFADVGSGVLTREFLESLGLLPEDVELVAFVVAEIKTELGIENVEAAGPRMRALLGRIAWAIRCE